MIDYEGEKILKKSGLCEKMNFGRRGVGSGLGAGRCVEGQGLDEVPTLTCRKYTEPFFR